MEKKTQGGSAQNTRTGTKYFLILATCAAICGCNIGSGMTVDESLALGKKAENGDAKALNTLLQKAMNNDANAQVQVGYLYDIGKGFPQDYTKAMLWYQKAADQGNARGERHVGYLYDSGTGVAQDYTQATKWYKKAADQDDSTAELYLGIMYTYGQGVAKDDTKAAKWFEKAANQGNGDAQYNLGVLYNNGQGVTQDYVRAAELFRKAADQGNGDAQYNLGMLYSHGNGVAQDDSTAIAWLKKAAKNKIDGAQEKIEEITTISDIFESKAPGTINTDNAGINSTLTAQIVKKLRGGTGNDHRSFTVGNMSVIYTPDALSGRGGTCIVMLAPNNIMPNREPMDEQIYVVKSTVNSFFGISIPDITGSAPRMKASSEAGVFTLSDYIPGPPKSWAAKSGSSQFSSILTAMRNSSSIKVDFGAYSLGQDVIEFDLRHFNEGLSAISTLCPSS